MAKMQANQMRAGMVIEFEGQRYTILKQNIMIPGKGAAVIQVEMRNIKTGKVIDNTFNAGVKVETARVEQRPHQYLYKDDYGYTFMDTDSFEQVVLPEAMVPFADLMKEGQEVSILFHAETEQPPPLRVRWTIASISSLLDLPILTRSSTGTPEMVV